MLLPDIPGRTICALGDAAAMPVRGMLKHYMDEFAYLRLNVLTS
jgi:NADH-quinone oxidoreductase subunit F